MQKASFDNYGSQYDDHFTFSPIGIYQRKVVYRFLMPILKPSTKVLEINCGTGHDALEIAKHVKEILATDASPKMIEICNEKKSKLKVENLKFESKLIQNITGELKEVDFVFSNFGGLNCISPDELKTFAVKCAQNLGDNSNIFFVIMGRKCFLERLYFLLKFDRAKAFRRTQKEAIRVTINNTEFNTWYYSPREIREAFKNKFEVKMLAPVGLFVPPSYLSSFFSNKKGLLKILNQLDNIVSKFSFTANYADHYLIHLKKTS